MKGRSKFYKRNSPILVRWLGGKIFKQILTWISGTLFSNLFPESVSGVRIRYSSFWVWGIPNLKSQFPSKAVADKIKLFGIHSTPECWEDLWVFSQPLTGGDLFSEPQWRYLPCVSWLPFFPFLCSVVKRVLNYHTWGPGFNHQECKQVNIL